jgi:hypothetical protein
MELEKDVLLRYETRTLTFRDGTRRRIGAFDVVWRWYDRLTTNVLDDDPCHVLDLVEMDLLEGEGWDDVFARIVPYMVWLYSSDGFDLLGEDDALIEIECAQRAIQEFHKRNKGSA